MAVIQAGQIIQERYKVLRSLGTGGMAEVFLAEDLRLNRKIALKVIRMDDIPSSMRAEVHKRFEREPIALAQMQHPYIVTIHDFGFYQNEPYFVMDYVSGGTLEYLVGSGLDYHAIAKLLAPIADALAYAHDRNILHRDVKPANILLTPEGKPVLTDFGISKVIAQDNKTSLTQAGMSVGTPAYMAPEQWMGNVYPQTDGYALGIVFYQMLIGEVPFTDEITMNIALKHMNAPVPQVCKSKPGIPKDVDIFLAKALAKDPKNRFRSMHEYSDALKALSEGRALTSVMGAEATMIGQTLAEEEATQLAHRAATPPGQPILQQRMPTPQGQMNYPPQPSFTPQTPGNFPQGQYGIPPQQAYTAPSPKKGMPIWVWLVIGGGLITLVVIGIGILALLGVFDRAKPSTTEEAAIWLQLTVAAFTKEAEDAAAEEAGSSTSTVEVIVSTPQPDEATRTPLPTNTPENLSTPTPVGFQPGDTMVWNKDGMTMVYIPEGDFEMGSESWKDPDTYTINEGPIHIVYLDAFWIDQTEVTNQQFSMFVDQKSYTTSAETLGSSSVYNADYTWSQVNGADWRHPRGGTSSYNDNDPVVHVSWTDAKAYCVWAGKRLPTEAEWEKAARGTEGIKYPWGNTAPSSQLANYNDPGGSPRSVRSYPQGVSPYGVYEMAGNVWEVVSDWYDKDYYQNTPLQNPQGPDSSEYHVAKGGSYGFEASVIRSAVRVRRGAGQTFSDMGFRCVAEP